MFGSIYTWSLSNVRDKTFGFPFNQYFPFLFLSLMGFGAAIFATFFPLSLDSGETSEITERQLDEKINSDTIDSKVTNITVAYFTPKLKQSSC